MNNTYNILNKLDQLQDYIAELYDMSGQESCEFCDDYECECHGEECSRDKWIMFIQWLKQEIYKN